MQTIYEQNEEEEIDDRILRGEVVIAIVIAIAYIYIFTKTCKVAGVDNIPAELITFAGEEMTDIFHKICSYI